MVKRIKHKIPMSEGHLSQVRELFNLYDKDQDDSLTLNELATLLQELGNKITALPAVRDILSVQLRDSLNRSATSRRRKWPANKVIT